MLSGKFKENLRKIKQQFEIYITVAGIKDKAADVQCSALLHIGPDAVEVLNTFKLDEVEVEAGDDKKVDTILGKYEKYCSPQCNVTFERHQFNTRNQKEGESIYSFCDRSRILSKSCEFDSLLGPGLAHPFLINMLTALKGSHFSFLFVCGVIKDTVRNRLHRETDLTFQKAIDMCRSAETSTQQLKALQSLLAAEGNVR